MSPDVVEWLLALVNSVTLNAGGDDFEEVAAIVVKAKRELAAQLDVDPA